MKPSGLGRVLPQPAQAEGQPQFRNGVGAGRLAASSIELPELDKSRSLILDLPRSLGVWWMARPKLAAVGGSSRSFARPN